MLEADFELVGDDGGERGFAQTGRAEEEDVVERFAAGFGGFKGDGELLLRLLLADELGEAGGAELELEGLVVVDAGGGDEAVGFGGADGDGGFGVRLFGKFHAEAIVGRMAGLSKMGVVRGGGVRWMGHSATRRYLGPVHFVLEVQPILRRTYSSGVFVLSSEYCLANLL